MRKYEQPWLEVEIFTVEDVMSESNGNGQELPDEAFP